MKHDEEVMTSNSEVSMTIESNEKQRKRYEKRLKRNDSSWNRNEKQLTASVAINEKGMKSNDI